MIPNVSLTNFNNIDLDNLFFRGTAEQFGEALFLSIGERILSISNLFQAIKHKECVKSADLNSISSTLSEHVAALNKYRQQFSEKKTTDPKLEERLNKVWFNYSRIILECFREHELQCGHIIALKSLRVESLDQEESLMLEEGFEDWVFV